MRTFFRETDYQLYLELLAASTQAHGLAVWAYCLMPNHVHLVAVPESTGSLAAALRPVHRRYAEIVNRRFRWTGHLWQERFYSFPMDSHYCLQAVRYVHSNPVRAGLATSAEDWPWSSARAIAGLETAPLLGSPSADLGESTRRDFPLDDTTRAIEAIRGAGRNGRPLGDESFVRALEEQLGRPLRAQPSGRPRIRRDVPF